MSILNQVMGIQEDYTADVAPVVASMSRAEYAKRMERRKEPARPVKESEEESLFPSDAKEFGTAGMGQLTTKLREPRATVMEPSYPTAEREAFMTPYTALTAPDCTPDALEPIDPSKVPGSNNSEQAFKYNDVKNAAPATELNAPDGTSQSVKVMDQILGRTRTGTPTSPNAVPVIATEAQAYAALNISPAGVAEAAAAKAAAALNSETVTADGRSATPDHVPGTGREILESFHRFTL